MEPNEERKDYYAVLGVPPSASQEAIGRAYRRSIKAVHPDAHRGASDPAVGRRVAELVEAWKVLGNPSRRADYDRRRLVEAVRPAASEPASRPQALPPRLEIEPRILDLGVVRRGENATGSVCLHNLGGRATSVELSHNLPNWISVSKDWKGGELGFPLHVAVRIDTSKLAARHRHRAELKLRLANPTEGLRSDEVTLVVTLAVAPEHPPRLRVKPGDWVVRPCECAGAPRSLVLHLLVSNEGGGAEAGFLQGEPWMRVASRRFGPLSRASGTSHIAVEVDCQEWEAAGTPDGFLWVGTDAGELRQVSLVGMPRREPTQVDAARTRWLLPLGLTICTSLAAVAVLSGLPAVALALALVTAVGLPVAAGRMRRKWSLAVGPRREADGWELGPRGDVLRLWLVVSSWAVLGGVLGASAGTWRTWGVAGPSLVLAGAVSGCASCLSVSARDGLVLAPVRFASRHRVVALATLSLAAITAWVVLVALGFQGVLGGVIEAGASWGALTGWIVGNVVVCGRNPDFPSEWRRAASGILWGIVPTLLAGMGFGLALDGTVGWWAEARSGSVGYLAPAVGGGSAALLGLPGAGLASALVGIAGCLGLLAGFVLGAASLVPIVKAEDVAAGGWLRRTAGAGKAVSWVVDLLARHARVEETGGRDAGRQKIASFGLYLMAAHWSTLLVVAGTAFLLFYVGIHLLLALSAAVGILLY